MGRRKHFRHKGNLMQENLPTTKNKTETGDVLMSKAKKIKAHGGRWEHQVLGRWNFQCFKNFCSTDAQLLVHLQTVFIFKMNLFVVIDICCPDISLILNR